MPARVRADNPSAGYTVIDVCKRLRVGPDKVRVWIKSGKLKAINTQDIACARPRFVVLPDALEQFIVERLVITPPPPRTRRRRAKQEAGWVEYYPD